MKVSNNFVFCTTAMEIEYTNDTPQIKRIDKMCIVVVEFKSGLEWERFNSSFVVIWLTART